jgi:hypothetical protein
MVATLVGVVCVVLNEEKPVSTHGSVVRNELSSSTSSK